MRKMIAGALMAVLVITAAPAYAQTNTELLRSIDRTTEGIAADLNNLLRDMGVLLGDLRTLLDRLGEAIPLIESNSESIKNIEAAILGEACGPGTTPINGLCVAEIAGCDAEVVDGVCQAAVHCGEGTLLHVDTCIADVSISYCGEGTVFSGGVCVVAPHGTSTIPGQTAPTQPGFDPEPTIVQPTTTNRYVLDGDTIRVGAGPSARTYDLAFVSAPDLDEAGGREAVLFTDGLCGEGPITVTPESEPVGLNPHAIIHCGSIDASQAIVLAGHADFDLADCAIRDFVDVRWTEELCAAGTPATPPPTTTTTTATPTTPAATMPAPTQPVRGSLSYMDFTFPVTVGDILQWERAADGDPMATATVSCLFEHTPSTIDAVIADNSGGVYNIDLAPTYNGNDRHDTTVTLTAPRNIQMFDQKFPVGDGSYVVYDREADILSVGGYDGNYVLAMTMADWDDITWSDSADPPVPTEAERDQKVLDIELRILTEITNNDCTMSMSGVTPGERNEYTELLALAAEEPGDNVLFDILPHDVSCSESITITAINADATYPFIAGYDTIHVYDNETGDEHDDTIGNALSGPALTGQSFVSANFVVGSTGENPSRIAPVDRDEVNHEGVALMSVTYQATSDDVCTWTERTTN